MSLSFAERDTVVMNAKGQITLPKLLRAQLNLSAGDEVRLTRLADGRVVLTPRTGSIEDLFGVVKTSHAAALSIEEMNEAIARAAAESGLRGMTRSVSSDHADPAEKTDN